MWQLDVYAGESLPPVTLAESDNLQWLLELVDKLLWGCKVSKIIIFQIE